MAWTQNQRLLSIYMLPLQGGLDMTDDRVMGSSIPATWQTPQQNCDVTDEHHQRLIGYTSLTGSMTLRRARLFPSVVPVWVRTEAATDAPQHSGYEAPRGDLFPTILANHVRQRGGILLLTMVPSSLSRIQDGTQDAYLAAFGTAMGNWMKHATDSVGNSDKGWAKRSEVVFRLLPECNELPYGKPQYPDWSAARFKDASGKMHDKLTAALEAVQAGLGSKLYHMVHFTNKYRNAGSVYPNYLPASGQWDILGVSIYARNVNKLEMGIARQAKDVVTWTVNKHATKHIWLAEIGANDDATGINSVMRGRWLRAGLKAIQQSDNLYWKHVKAFLYSDYIDTSEKDWRLQGASKADGIATVYSFLADRGAFQQDVPFET